jgi:hypothetical protein
MLKRYFVLSFVILSSEAALLFLFRTPLKEVEHVPPTYEEIAYKEKSFFASLLPNLFVSSEKKTSPAVCGTIKMKHTVLEEQLISSGLVNIKTIDSSIVVDLKYAGEDNFLHKNLYGELKNCYLQSDIAVKLSKAQASLKKNTLSTPSSYTTVFVL